MQSLFTAIEHHPFKHSSVRRWSPSEKLKHDNEMWNGECVRLQPARPTTAWLRLVDPMMNCSSDAFRTVEVREKEFALQKEAIDTCKGKRKLSKKAIGEALSTPGQLNKDQMWIFMAVLYECKRIQTVLWDDSEKKVSTYPEDLRNWSATYKTIWIDTKAERAVEWPEDKEPALGKWLSDREAEGWSVDWPLSELSMEEMKLYVSREGISVASLELGAKVKKGDYMRVVGKAQAVRHLSSIAQKGLGPSETGYLD